MNKITLTVLFFTTAMYPQTIEINGTLSAKNHQIKNVDNTVPYVNLTDTTFYIDQEIDGVNVSREVIIEVPNRIDSSINYPIVIAFHGRTVENDTWINKLNHLTGPGEFIGVYPQGHKFMWNSGGNEKTTADDVAFVDAILVALQVYKNLDFERVYAMGTSNGASMTNKLALETSHFNAVSNIVSQLSTSALPNSNTYPTAVFQVNGTADTIIPIEGGPKLGYVFLDALESAEQWAIAYKCDDYKLKNIGSNSIYIFSNCNEGKEIRYLRIEDGAHNLHWGNPQLFTDIWDFLKNF